ncbi:MAG: iron-sulfur cluster assembly scaffold protein [Acidobacteriota bacterium]
MKRTIRYNETVLDHFHNPRHVGVVEAPDAEAWVSNPACGDTVRLTLRITDGVIREARFKALGCVAAIAAASRLTEILHGLTIIEAAGLRDAALAESLGGLPEEKVRCSVLAEKAVAEALADHQARAGEMNQDGNGS